ncbi:M23 family metallopeptidase [Leifsonia flava]|uniref:M23 family metallopeptidase n=1 Tax=Orlajensenia leifsoniae TaxID=2561933 RepID=A0A4Y9QZJ9_9MICO|nr:M23 family metallopeptidase [Leifsonia flava]TFV98011.1 M23 family metallopeptidase [Leifsonia flava]
MRHDPLTPASSGVGGSPDAGLTRREIRERERALELAAALSAPESSAASQPVVAESPAAESPAAESPAAEVESDVFEIPVPADVPSVSRAADDAFLALLNPEGVTAPDAAPEAAAATASDPAVALAGASAPAADDAPFDDASATPSTAVLPAIVPATSVPGRDRAALRVELPAADLPPAPAQPSSRREARSTVADDVTAPSRGRRAAPVRSLPERAGVPTAPIPVPAQTSVTRRVSRHLAAKGMAGLAIVVVALLAVATSTPANALLSAADVQQAAAIAAATGTDSGVAQTVTVGDDVSAYAVQRDGYDTSTVAQVAAESGIRLEASFTNDPNGTVQWPFRVGVHIGDQFGARDCAGCSSDHHGQDFNPGLGAPIQAIADGVVSYAEDGDGDLGVHMMIDHVINGQVVTSVYAHMIHGSMLFKEGDTVKVGDVIGKTGDTGMSTGPHLHFEIRLGGKTGPWTDPLEWLYANVN